MKLLSFNDAPLVRSLFEKYPPIFSEFTFSNLMMWSEQRPTYYEEIDDTIQFMVEKPGLIAFGPPFGPLTLHEMLPKLPVTKAIRMPLPKVAIPGWAFFPSPGDADYVYKVSDLIELPGHRYHRKRQLLRGCLNRYECSYEPLTQEIIPECLDLQQRIIAHSPPDEGQMKEHRAARFFMTHYARFHSFGGAIRINGRVEGVIIVSKLNETTAVGHIEKLNPEIHGLSALLHHWLAKKTLHNFVYFNVEQDLGVPGIRDSKQRFNPDHMIVKYTGDKL